MTILEFARGPAMQWALWIFAFGVLWRLIGSFLLLGNRRLFKPRSTGTVQAGVRSMVMRSIPPHELEKKITFQHITGYAWHLGFFAAVLLFGPHIPFFKQFLGFGWPALPNTLLLVISGFTLAILVAILVRRLIHPVLKRISTFDDYVSVILTILPLLTGILAYSHIQPFGIRYETLLGLHLTSVWVLIAWFPFSKLMHLFYAFPARYRIGAAMERKGVKA